MAAIPSFPANVIEGICRVLGDTGSGLTGSEIGRLLDDTKIEDPAPGITKWQRLREALQRRQTRDRCANNVVAFVHGAMAPVRYMNAELLFSERRTRLNEVLSFVGLQVSEKGLCEAAAPAATIPEARERAGRLRQRLEERNTHPDVLRFCTPELVAEDYFHAVLEVCKSICQKLRDRTGIDADGSPLIDAACALGQSGVPLLAFNTLRSQSERMEQNGLVNLMKGVVGAYRDPTAHDPRLSWPISEADALDVLSLASLIHRRIDTAVATDSRPG